ncbi:MAG TPA: signal peptidase I [Egicoccus sp.]|nr:signal peptidase I [Egicoccus sp.]HSK24773.1 signal peptidase I [Egicoccus sp.]
MLQWVVTGGLVLAIYAGWAGAVMVSGDSMLPVFENGDIVLFTHDNQYEVGDIAVFNIPEGVGQGQSVIHRIVDGSSEQGWIFKGDNRDMQDPWLVRDRDITGKPRFVLPGGTTWLRWAADRSPFVIAGLVTLLTAIATFPSKDKKTEASEAEVEEEGDEAEAQPRPRRRRSTTSQGVDPADGNDTVEHSAVNVGERSVS